MNILIISLAYIFFIKCFLFWLWLWQLKEYHIGRFLAHFEGQKFKKFISSFWRVKCPKFTKKIIVIFFVGILLSILLFFYYPLALFILIVFSSIFTSLLVFLFQIPTFLLRIMIIGKAKKKRAQFKDLLAIGITGSYGKSSTKEFLAEILSEKYNVLKTKENQNSEMGISRCILNELKKEHQIFICEMGAYNKGGVKLLCDIVKPKIGIVTGVNEQHLATFGKMENLLSAEGGKELVDNLPANGIAFLNAKNKYCRQLYEKTKIKKFFYGEEAVYAGGENILGAAALAKELGLSQEQISRAVNKIGDSFPGIKISKTENGLIIVDAAYSINPDGVSAHLEYLKNKFPQSRKIIIMPCLIELGFASIQIHKNIGQKIAEICSLAIITTGDRFKEIKNGFLSANGREENIFLIEKPEDILEKIKNFCCKEDVILLEGRIPKKVIDSLKI